ncbi:MAG: hypothetical protein Q7U75_16180, partial [Desulfobacterales bacterium]|nr:hypothetical protein [Desulfobacterales bacterium]
LVIHSQQSARYLDETFETLLFEGTWTVVSGTGRYAGATGGGGVRGWWVFSNHEEEPAIGETVFQGTISSVGGTKR